MGLTGRLCAGKDSVAAGFAAEGFAVIDVDALGHEALALKAREVAAAFGAGVAAADGTVDRRALGRLVFADPAARARLEAIVHPPMRARVVEEVRRRGPDVVVNAALLARMGLVELCGAVVYVDAPFVLRLLRALRRDRRGLRDTVRRLRSQPDVRPQRNGNGVDTYTVRNWGRARVLRRRAGELARRLKG